MNHPSKDIHDYKILLHRQIEETEHLKLLLTKLETENKALKNRFSLFQLLFNWTGTMTFSERLGQSFKVATLFLASIGGITALWKFIFGDIYSSFFLSAITSAQKTFFDEKHITTTVIPQTVESIIASHELDRVNHLMDLLKSLKAKGLTIDQILSREAELRQALTTIPTPTEIISPKAQLETPVSDSSDSFPIDF